MSTTAATGGHSRNLLLLGEHALLLQGLARLLQEQTGATVRTVTKIDDLAGELRRLRPEAILIATSDVIAASAMLEHAHGAARGTPWAVIAPGTAEQFLAAVRAGAQGFIGQHSAAEELGKAIETIVRGDLAYPRSLTGALAEAYRLLSGRPSPVPAVVLTDRQCDVLRLLAQGESAERIGQRLFVSEGTVRAEIRAVIQKLGVENRVQAVQVALQQGMIELT